MNSNWSYSPETLNSGQNRQVFVPCDLEIWGMTLKNNRAPLLSNTVVKRTRVPAGSLVKMETAADVDSGRKMTLIQSVEAYTRIVLSRKIHGGIRNIQCKSRLRGTFHSCTIALRKNIFWRGCFVFMFCRCRGYLYFFTRVPGIVTRVPALYRGAWFVSHFQLPRVSPNFGCANEATNLWTMIL